MKKLTVITAIILSFCILLLSACSEPLSNESASDEPVIPENVVQVTSDLYFEIPSDVEYFGEAEYEMLKGTLQDDAWDLLCAYTKAFYDKNAEGCVKTIELESAKITENNPGYGDNRIQRNIYIPYHISLSQPNSSEDIYLITRWTSHFNSNGQRIADYGWIKDCMIGTKSELSSYSFGYYLADNKLYQGDFSGSFFISTAEAYSHFDLDKGEWCENQEPQPDFFPSFADESWMRFYTYGGKFNNDQWNNWSCNINGYTLNWVEGQWTYLSQSGDYFIQYKNSDYLRIDHSDPYYYWNMHSLTGWVEVSDMGITDCEEPQIFINDVNALKKSLSDSAFEYKVKKFNEISDFNCYEGENGWILDTPHGTLHYDPDNKQWIGRVDVYNGATDTWLYDVEIMTVNAGLESACYFRFADGRYDDSYSGVELDGKIYNITYGLFPEGFYINELQ